MEAASSFIESLPDWMKPFAAVVAADHAIFSLRVPGVVLTLIGFAILFFAFSLARLLFLYVLYRVRLRDPLRTLRIVKTQKGDGEFTPALLNQLGAVLRGNPIFSHGWRELTETLVRDGSAERERIFNTRQANDFFSEDTILEEALHPSFFRSVPPLLTSIGLLGTFLAILLGLANIKYSIAVAQTPAHIEGIDGFINALAGKFLSSVVALLFAIVFTLLDSAVFRSAHRSHRKFCELLDAILPRRTAEELLTTIGADIRSQGAAFEHFNTDLSIRFRDGVAEGLGPVLERLSNGLESLAANRDSNIEALMERLTSEFRSAMSQSAGVEFGQIASAMSSASRLIEDANRQSSETQGAFRQLVTSMEESRAQQEALNNRQSSTITQLLNTMVATVSGASSESQAALNGTLQSLMERTRKESADAAATLEATLRRYSENMNEQMAALLGRVDRATAKMEDAGTSGSQELLATIQRVSERMEQATSTVVTETGASQQKIAAELDTLLREHRASVGVVTDTRTALEHTLVVWREGTEEMRAVLGPLTAAARQLDQATVALRSAGEEVTRTQQRLGDIFGGVQSELSRLESMGVTHSQTLSEHRRVFEVVQHGLAGSLQTITDKLGQLQELSAKGLTNQLQQFDNHLGTATQKLGAAIDELGEVLEDAASTIGDAARPRT